jgi:hypothetical protein
MDDMTSPINTNLYPLMLSEAWLGCTVALLHMIYAICVECVRHS